MASKLTLRFTETPLKNETILVFTGASYVFKTNRTGFRQVTIGDAIEVAGSFASSFNADDNYLKQFTVNSTITNLDEAGLPLPQGVFHGICTIEHFENDKFNTFSHSTTGLLSDISTTTQESPATLDVSLAQSTTDTCGKFLLNIASNVTGGRVTVEMPIGNTVLDITTGELPYAFDRIRPATAASGVVKLFETEFTTDVLKSVFFTAPGVLSVSDVKVTGSPFGAVVHINANGINLEYSLDGTTYQGSKEYSGLLAGNYTAYVKDSYGCIKTKTFEVTEAQTSGLTVDPFIRVPIHNSIRFAERSGDTFLNTLANETPGHGKIYNYFQDYLVGDTVRTQFKSSHPSNRVYLIDSEGAETEIAVVKKSDNISRKNIYDGNYADVDGRLAIYFDAGNIYNLDYTVKDTHALNGLLPNWYKSGLYVNIEGVGVTQIDRLSFDEDAEIMYAITQKNGIGTVLNKKITSIHTAAPYEVYEFETTFLTEGKYQLRLDYGSGVYLSEIIRISTELDENFLTVQWFSKNNNDILYGTGIKQLRRIEWEDYFSLVPEAEIESYDTDTKIEKVNSKTFATYNLSLDKMPMELARGLQTGIDHGTTIIINGAVFSTQKGVELEPQGKWYIPKLELTLTDQTISGQQVLSDVIIPEFLQVVDGQELTFLNLSL